MEKIEKENGQWLLKAVSGCVIYTDNDGERIFGSQVLLPHGVTADDWHECTEAEKIEYEREHYEEN